MITRLPAHLIRKKRFGSAHTREELRFLVQGIAGGQIPDYQIAAWLMAVCFQGMTDEETTWFTHEMRDSGAVLDLTKLGISVDKHSTGGVGDKTSLILAPLVAAAGVPVPMMAGRGLGHTGGTIDKLESISGFSTNLSFQQFHQQVASVKTAIIGQSQEVCPADRKLYALRDVTGTVDSLPLICGSIMSKKLAEGMAALVLDVKFGSGAFMKTLEDAEKLARALISIGVRSGKKVSALLTRMDEPLGRFVGNALEVQECLDILQGHEFAGEGKNYADTIELTLELAGHMIFLGGRSSNPHDGRILAEKLLKNGSAYNKFVEMCGAQGGNLNIPMPKAEQQLQIFAQSPGFMNYLDLEKLGSAGIMLGAGRRTQADVLDLGAGIEVFRSQSDPVKAGDPLFTLFASDETKITSALSLLNESYNIAPRTPPKSPLIAKVIL